MVLDFKVEQFIFLLINEGYFINFYYIFFLSENFLVLLMNLPKYYLKHLSYLRNRRLMGGEETSLNQKYKSEFFSLKTCNPQPKLIILHIVFHHLLAVRDSHHSSLSPLH